MSFVERVNQGESLASWLNWLTEPPAASKSGPTQMPPERVQEAVLCTAW